MDLILLADDERLIREGLKERLTGEGYEVKTAKNGAEAVELFVKLRPSLVVLDVMMPKQNGFKACEAIRKLDSTVPVIFLTASDSDLDEVRGIELGADDYVTKSSPDAVLISRIRRALERMRQFQKSDDNACPTELKLDQVTVDMANGEVRNGDGDRAYLTPTQLGLLRLLAANVGNALTVEQLICSLRGIGYACSDDMIYVHVSNLRRKLGKAGRAIVNNHKLGYQLKM